MGISPWVLVLKGRREMDSETGRTTKHTGLGVSGTLASVRVSGPETERIFCSPPGYQNLRKVGGTDSFH